MEVTEKQLELVVVLCQKVCTTANLIGADCAILLQEANETLNEEQAFDIGAIHRASQKLFSIADHAKQAIFRGIYTSAGQEEISYLAACLANDLMSPLGLILGFSQVSLQGVNGSWNDEHKEVLKHIQELGQVLRSDLTAPLTQAHNCNQMPNAERA